MEKKEELFQLIHDDSLNKIKNGDLDHLGLDALDISIKLKMDRSNISRLLNQLYHEGRLIKTSTRPVIFIDRLSLNESFENVSVPSILSKNSSIKDYVSFQPKNEDFNKDINSFKRYIDNPRQSKMYEPIKKAKAALLYPNGLNTLIFGERGSGRFQFAKCMAQYAKEIKLIDHGAKINIIDCINYSSIDEESFLKMMFGEYVTKTETYKRGIFQNSQKSIIIFNNLDYLPARASNSLLNTILDKSYSPMNSSKRIPLDTYIIATSTSDNLFKNPDIRRCFPMLIDLPNLYQRTIIEKLAIILQYFQDEASTIRKTIRISKDALSCFVMSEYNGNLAQLRAEIRQSCALGYKSYINQEGIFIDIGFDEISTEVLTNITNINERLEELYDTLNLFNNKYIFFSSTQPCDELNLLFDLNKPVTSEEVSSIQKVNDELINQCISDIDAASSIQLNSIRSILLQKIYDLVYPILNGHPIKENENLIYGLMLQISNEINRVTSKQETTTFSKLSRKIARKFDYEYARKIINAIGVYYGISVDDTEEDYIATYLYLSSQWIDKKYIQLLLISTDNKTAQNYSDYINNQYFKTRAHYLSIQKNQSPKSIGNQIATKIKEIDKGKGVVLISDYTELNEIKPILTKLCPHQFLIIKDMSVQNIVTITERIESLSATINSMNIFDSMETDANTNKNTKEIENHANQLLKSIEEKVLSESLVFLNPTKACQALFNVLINILNDLGIPYSDDLLIKFLFHTTFTLERCIKKEPYNYTKSRTLIKKYDTIFNVLEKNFKVINEIFAIQIPITEMGYIIEIFLPYLHHSSKNT